MLTFPNRSNDQEIKIRFETDIHITDAVLYGKFDPSKVITINRF